MVTKLAYTYCLTIFQNDESDLIPTYLIPVALFKKKQLYGSVRVLGLGDCLQGGLHLRGVRREVPRTGRAKKQQIEKKYEIDNTLTQIATF